jgi:hypothetical protein
MIKQIDAWDEISGLIALEKKAALDDFRRREFVPGALPGRRSEPAAESRPVMRRAALALAASIFFAAGLASLWLLKGSWGSISSAPALAEVLRDSYLYGQAGSAEAAPPANLTTAPTNPYFTAWVAAALRRPAAGTGTAGPFTAVERGNPVAVRRKLSRVIRENALERLLTQFREIHNQEA